MKHKFFIISLLGLIFPILAACKPLETATPPPSPQPVRVAFPPSLRPYTARFHQCALEQPGISLIMFETGDSDMTSIDADVTLWFGEPPQGVHGYALSLGSDEIVIIAGEQVMFQDLEQEKLKDLYTKLDVEYQMWTYGKENGLRLIFDQAIMGETLTSYNALLVPDPSAMIEVIREDPLAIGYLPRSWITDEIKTIPVEEHLEIQWNHPVLALTDIEPVGNLYNYLVCVQ